MYEKISYQLPKYILIGSVVKLFITIDGQIQ